MITVTKIDGSKIVLNADEIEQIETTHDSTITLRTGKRIIIKEKSQELIDLVIDYKQKCFSAFINSSNIQIK